METIFDKFFDTLDTLDKDDIEMKDRISSDCCSNYKNFSMDEGVTICKICNNTISNIIDSPEWRSYSSSTVNTTRCGMPVNVLLPNSSLGTSISGKKRNEKMNKINMYQKWNSMPYRERSLYKVFIEIEQKCNENDLPPIISTTAKSLYKIISGTKISRGSNRKGIIAASVYYSCKECNVPRSTNELASIFDIDVKVMTRGCKNFTEIMRISDSDKNRIQSHKSVNLDDFIERFCHKLSINETDIKNILHISGICQEKGLVNDNTPPAMASGCIYLYIKSFALKISKRNISDICKISEVTINKCYKKLDDVQEITIFIESVRGNNLKKISLNDVEYNSNQ